MSSNRQTGIIVVLIIASLIGIGVLAFRKMVFFSCQIEDKQVCTFLRNYKNISNTPLHGTYTFTNNEDDSTYSVSWQKHKEKRIISVVQEEKQILDAIITNGFLYLKDYSDDLWWKQKVSDSPLYLSYIPFDPYSYFYELDPILMDSETAFTRIGEITCEDKTCIRYRVESPKQSKDLQRFIYVTSSDMQLYSVVDADTSSLHEIKIKGGSQWIYEPTKVKIPAADQNIFLDYITRRDQEREKQLEYLKEFQDERRKAEELENNGPLYVEESETATPSAN